MAVHDEGEGHAGKRQERRDGRRPVYTDIIVHLRREEREHSADDRAQDSGGGEDGSRKDRVRVNQIIDHGQYNQHAAEAERRREDDGRGPVDAGVVGPREGEHADGQGDGACDGGREAGFGFGCFGHEQLHVARLVVPHGVYQADDDADCDAQEGEPAGPFAPAAVAVEDDGHGAQEHVHRAVDDGHVDACHEHDRLSEEQDPWSEEGSLEDFRRLLFSLALFQDADVDFAVGFGELLRSLVQ